MSETPTETRPRATLGPIAPFFIVSDLERAIRHYEGTLGFEVRLRAPPGEPFFAIVERDGARIHLKSVGDGVRPSPNCEQHRWARWDAFVFVEDPDALAEELSRRGSAFRSPLADTDEGLQGFEVADADGYVLFFGRPR